MEFDTGEDNITKGKDDTEYGGLNRKSSNYYRKLAQCSCNYNESKREGIIYTFKEDDSKKVKFMLQKKIKMLLCDCNFCIFLLTEDGEVYHWWDPASCNCIIKYYANLNVDLRNRNIVQTACGGNSTFIFQLDNNMVYYFQTYDKHFLWLRKKINVFPKITCMSCGDSFFIVLIVVLTEKNKYTNHLYSWGKNDKGQLGYKCDKIFTDEHREVEFENPYLRIGKNYNVEQPNLLNFNVLVKIASGYTHTLALTDCGQLFVWGGNIFGQLGLNHTDNVFKPTLKEISYKKGEILDISAMKNISCAIHKDKNIYVWGYYSGQKINSFIPEYTILFDLSTALSARPPTTVKKVANEQCQILQDLRDAFDNHNNSDLILKISEQFNTIYTIHTHKIILEMGSPNFVNTVLKSRIYVDENGNNSVLLNKYTYNEYYAFVKYLYTGVIDLELEKIFEILKLANDFHDENFRKNCHQAIKKQISTKTVIDVYRTARKYNETTVEDFCFEFYANMSDVQQMIAYKFMDPQTRAIFMTKVNKIKMRRKNMRLISTRV